MNTYWVENELSSGEIRYQVAFAETAYNALVDNMDNESVVVDAWRIEEERPFIAFKRPGRYPEPFVKTASSCCSYDRATYRGGHWQIYKDGAMLVSRSRRLNELNMIACPICGAPVGTTCIHDCS